MVYQRPFFCRDGEFECQMIRKRGVDTAGHGSDLFGSNTDYINICYVLEKHEYI